MIGVLLGAWVGLLVGAWAGVWISDTNNDTALHWLETFTIATVLLLTLLGLGTVLERNL